MTRAVGEKSDANERRARRRALYIKLAIAIVFDILDGTLGRFIGLGPVSNILLTIVGVMLFGWRGAIQLWEMLDPTHQIDGFVPTLTLIALSELRRLSREGEKSPPPGK